MRQWRTLVLLFMVVPTAVSAGDFVCGDTTKLHQFSPSVDPTKVPNCPPAFTLSEVPEAQIPAQRTLYASLPKRYLKVIDGLMVEMTQTEKDVVDAPLQEEADRVADAQDELATQEYCAKQLLEEVTTLVNTKTSQIHTTVDTITDVATAKAADHANFDSVMALLNQVARCLLAARTTR